MTFGAGDTLTMQTKSGLGIAEIIGDKRDLILQIAAEHGAYNVRVFGSVARGEAREDSDIDLLIDMQKGRSMWDLIGLWQTLNERVGCEVNVIVAGLPNTRFMRNALNDAVPL